MGLDAIKDRICILFFCHKRRPCTFGQSLGWPIVRSISHFFWSTKENLSSLRDWIKNFWSFSEFFLVRLWFFGILKRNFGVPKRNLVDQKKSEPDQKFPETEQIFFGRPKKERNRLDNWSTKRLTKTTWTGLLSTKRLTKTTWTGLLWPSQNMWTLEDISSNNWFKPWPCLKFKRLVFEHFIFWLWLLSLRFQHCKMANWLYST